MEDLLSLRTKLEGRRGLADIGVADGAVDGTAVLSVENIEDNPRVRMTVVVKMMARKGGCNCDSSMPLNIV